ncbi:hypothetical protein FPRO05_11501 [Fusarium proliferatum]|uniref:FAS1 domain-containing protein n=1 Tax=Gibberella intermedia TaxID=948311 RepID=A0A365NAS3_GIBIN|nr:hypothetical protein FPRO05_11501 [Fusarium proliferatum]
MKFLNLAALASAVVAQSDLASILSSQSDLSTLAELLALVPDIAETLASASNITIFAPTNEAFASVPRDIPEGEAISQRNDTIAIGALLSNHVFKGYYPAKVATDIPVFVQSLLDSSFVNYRQPFGNFTGGQYNGIVKDGDDVVVISGEETLSYVTEADIRVGDSVIIHKVDKPLSFGAPLQLFTRRDNLLNFNAALNAADLPYNFGNLDRDSSTLVNISDFTVFIPNDPAFEAIGSVLESADLKTLQEVLKYHIVDDVLFSTDLANVSVPSLQGADLTFTVAEDGSAWVNGAKILFTNVLLFNGVAHVIDGVLNPADDPFDRADLKPAAEADDRLAFPDATPVSKLPFSVISYADDTACVPRFAVPISFLKLSTRRLARWSFFIFICYWSAEWISDHRGAISQLPLASTLVAAPTRLYQQYFSGGKPFSSSTFRLQEQSQPINMGSQNKHRDGLKEHLTHDKLDELRSFWFEHIPEEANRIIAPGELQKRWFFSDKEFDNVCVTRFSPVLEAIRNAGVTSAQELLSVAKPRNSLDWLSLIILLDQIPRNSYRGDKSSICFNYFDPIAQQVSLEAIKQGIPDKAPEIRWVFSHRNWFYMPLMHSEDISAHEKAVAAFEQMNQDILSLTEGTGGADEYERKAREVVQADPEAAKAVGETNKVFEEKHIVIVKRFGRYPHRNKALGREATPAEVEFLESGGDTFGS